MTNEATTDPYEVVASALKQIIDTEFAAENIHAIHDNIHGSLGVERAEVGIAPMREAPLGTNHLANSFFVEVRYYDLYDLEVDPEQTVNPTVITAKGNRLKRALKQAEATFPGTPEVWYFDWLDTEYPDDPTGNKTRFHMHIRALGDNTGLIETR